MKTLPLILLIVYVNSNFPQDNSQSISVEDIVSKKSNYHLFDYINSLTEDDYYLILDSIKNNLSDDFFSLRAAYTKTKHYYPYSIEERERFSRIEDKIMDEQYTEALEMLDTALSINFADVKAHYYGAAIYEDLYKINKSLGFQRNYKGLLESIEMSGDGDKPSTAFIVINTREEYSFLTWLDLEFLEQQLMVADGFTFDLVKVMDNQTGETKYIFFNISLAINSIR
jgi:hypothetical protein